MTPSAAEATLALAVGLATVVAGPSTATGALELVATNPSPGAVRLTATDPDWVGVQGTVVFTLEGHDPVSVPLGHWTVIGSPNFDQFDYDYSMTVPSDTAMLDIPGLDPAGTYTATATYVPADGSDPAIADAPPVTKTLTRTKTPLSFSVDNWDGFPMYAVGVAAYPLGTFVGRFYIVDLKTGEKVVRGASARAKLADDGTRAASRKPSRGVHQYRIFFTPNADYKDILTKAVVTSPKIRFSR
ncbi:MAG: hypothetical protein JWO76_124 [Nocardioides sp.]|nr:hypothetical protein [Nocardioides sp.]